MSVSVVVPVYQGAATLGECLDAVLRALPPGADLIVVDDGSTDDSGSIAAARGARVLRHATNRGTSAARNTGWRASTGDIVCYVDADVILYADALTRLVAWLDADPELYGVNGVLSIDRMDDLPSDFANLSIHFQHRCHGARVASAFTSVCALRRTTLEQMGGWEERWSSRYADDVVTRFHLPAGALGVDFDAQGRHAKRVPLAGLFKHRARIGFFFVQSALAHRTEVRSRPTSTVLAARYPLNSALAFVTVGAGALLIIAPPVGAPAMIGVGVGYLLVNGPYAAFVARHRGIRTATIHLFLSVAESYALGFGIVSGLTASIRPTLSPAMTS